MAKRTAAKAASRRGDFECPPGHPEADPPQQRVGERQQQQRPDGHRHGDGHDHPDGVLVPQQDGGHQGVGQGGDVGAGDVGQRVGPPQVALGHQGHEQGERHRDRQGDEGDAAAEQEHRPLPGVPGVGRSSSRSPPTDGMTLSKSWKPSSSTTTPRGNSAQPGQHLRGEVDRPPEERVGERGQPGRRPEVEAVERAPLEEQEAHDGGREVDGRRHQQGQDPDRDRRPPGLPLVVAQGVDARRPPGRRRRPRGGSPPAW